MKRGPDFKVKNLLAILFWAAVWHILAVYVDNFLLLPTPLQVLGRCGQLMATAEFWHITAVSIGRILLGVLWAMVLGLGLAVLTTVSSLANALVAPVMTAVQAAPVASFAILVLIWLERDAVPVLICGMMVLPVVWSNVCTGIRQTDGQLLELAKVYRLPKMRILRRIYVPSVLPYFRAACGSALGLGWKAGIAAEVLTVPKASMGRMISEAKLYLLTEDLFAWTLMVVVLSLLLQRLVLRLLKTGRSEP
ncbi:MAG: ABC transporter permease subunit [Oscillospiraceae bacterium]|nr:ABC transporter permease subunit [Oscillospiraceae bacterium]